MRLQGKVALVTGAGGGIGAATARRFAREGALVAVNDARAEALEAVADEIRAAGAKALAVPGAVAKKTDGQANYAASKAGVMGLTRTLALDDAAFITGQVIFVDGGMSVGV